MIESFHTESEDSSHSDERHEKLAGANVCYMNSSLRADCPVWLIEVIGKIISNAACDTVCLWLVLSPLCAV